MFFDMRTSGPNLPIGLDLNLPVNDFFIFPSDEVLLVWGDDAQGVLLARFGLCVYDVCTQVHVHGALRQRARLEETQH